MCTLQNIRKMSNLHKNDTNSLEETCIQLSAPALARLCSQRLAGRLAARNPAPGRAFHLRVFNIKATNSLGSARPLPPASCPPHPTGGWAGALALLLSGHGGEGAERLQRSRMAEALQEGGNTAEQPGVAGMCKTPWRLFQHWVGTPFLALCRALWWPLPSFLFPLFPDISYWHPQGDEKVRLTCPSCCSPTAGQHGLGTTACIYPGAVGTQDDGGWT